MRPPYETFKRPTCKGSYALGTACGTCEACVWERTAREQSETPLASIPFIEPRKGARIHLTVVQGVDLGARVHVEFKDEMPGLDAIAAIRALVDRTAQLTRLTPEKVLGLVEKQTVAVDAELPLVHA